MNSIEVEQLTKIYSGRITAVDSITFSVPQGEIFGFLGPNGAGKSTTIMMLTTLLRITRGAARIQGLDVAKYPAKVRQALGYVSQDLAVDDNLTGWENLFLQAKFYGLNRTQIRERLPEILNMVNLTERAGDLVETYSGGMRKRLDIAEGLIHRPKILFLDEPTLGLDIQTRAEIWKYITHLRRQEGMTIFLTTHYMEEADRLCDRIAIIDRGRIRAIDAPAELKKALGGDVVTFELTGAPAGQQALLATLAALPGVRQVSPADGRQVAIVENGEKAVPQFFAAAHAGRAGIASITVKQPTLDDVYLHHTGKELRDEESSQEEAVKRRITMRRTRH